MTAVYRLDDIQINTDGDATQNFKRWTPDAAATVGTISMLDSNWSVSGGAPNRVAAITDGADATGLTSPGLASSEATQGRLGVTTAGNLALTVRLSKPSGSTATSARVELLHGTTVIASRTVTLTTTPTDTTLTLTTAENAAVTDREQLSWRVVGQPA